MKDAQNTAVRFRLVLMIILALIAALGSFWLLEVIRKQESGNGPSLKQTEPDYEVEKFNFVRTSANGQAHYLVSGKHLSHYLTDNIIKIQSPVIQSIRPDEAMITATAKEARLTEDNQHVQLVGDVNVSRPATPESGPLQIQTLSLLILTESDTMQTNDPVKINFGKSVVESVGMQANSATGVIELSHQVRSILRKSTTP